MTTFSPAVFGAPCFGAFRELSGGLGDGPAFPDFAVVDRALSSRAGVRFVAPLPRRRRGAPVDVDALYDARIVVHGEVPTRANWHDLANALVWARFPLAKRALHARQLRAITAGLSLDATRLPGARTAEQDALAMLDEGGLLIQCDDAAPGADAELLRSLCAEGRATVHVFGHALLEHVAEGRHGDILAAVACVARGRHPDQALAELLVRGDFPSRRGDLGSLWLGDAVGPSKAPLRRGRPASLLRHRMADELPPSRKSPLNSTRLDQTRAVASDPSSSTIRRRVGVFLITSGEDTGRVVRVPHGAVVSFGRSHECTVQLPDEGLSRIHSRCLRLGEAYMLDDNKSTNGTYVNGKKISSATQLSDGDAVGLGRATKLRFTIMDEGEAETLEEIYLARRSGKSALITADLEQDLAQAREFQQRLLRQHPNLPGVEIDVLYQPVDQVGGDVYQMHVLADGSLRLFVADAVGHGVQASLTTMLIVSEYEATRHLQSPAAALAALNESLVTKFAHARVQFTAACVDVRFREREIVFAAAGHPAPCVVRAGVFEELDAVGPILGVIPGISISESSVDLADGDHLLLFTDGCTEVFDGSEVYGDEGLQRTTLEAIASRQKISDAVAAAMLAFSRGRPLADDATLLAIGFRAVGQTVPTSLASRRSRSASACWRGAVALDRDRSASAGARRAARAAGRAAFAGRAARAAGRAAAAARSRGGATGAARRSAGACGRARAAGVAASAAHAARAARARASGRACRAARACRTARACGQRIARAHAEEAVATLLVRGAAGGFHRAGHAAAHHAAHHAAAAACAGAAAHARIAACAAERIARRAAERGPPGAAAE